MHTHYHHALTDRLRAFAHAHDDIPAFHAAFLVWTFLAAAVLNVGFFGVLIFIHVCLDIVKYRDVEGLNWRQTFRGVIHESLIDITLFFVALTSAVYLHHSFALSILAGLSRTELTLMRAASMIFAKMHILEYFVHMIAHFYAYLQAPHPDLHRKRYSHMQITCFVLLAAGIILLALSPLVFADARSQLAEIFVSELIPWNI